MGFNIDLGKFYLHNTLSVHMKPISAYFIAQYNI